MSNTWGMRVLRRAKRIFMNNCIGVHNSNAQRTTWSIFGFLVTSTFSSTGWQNDRIRGPLTWYHLGRHKGYWLSFNYWSLVELHFSLHFSPSKYTYTDKEVKDIDWGGGCRGLSISPSTLDMWWSGNSSPRASSSSMASSLVREQLYKLWSGS